MTKLHCALLACIAVSLVSGPALAQQGTESGIVTLRDVAAALAEKSRKAVSVDPRVTGEVPLLGQELSRLDYAGLLNVLASAGFTAVEVDGIVRVIPIPGVRTMPTPIVSGRESLPDAQIVTRLIEVRTMPAVQLVPVLRPLVPQEGHLVAIPCKNVLLLTDTFGNSRRLEALIRGFDRGEPYSPPACDAPPPALAPAELQRLREAAQQRRDASEPVQ